MSLNLTHIPSIMRYHGWYNGARLMDTWFTRPSAAAPTYGAPDTDTIKMDSWVLTFQRAREVYDDLLREAIWSNEAAERQIRTMLQRRGLLTSGSASFGDLQARVEGLDTAYVNQRPVDVDVTDGLDDMFAALGRFNLRVVVAGEVEPITSETWRVSLQEVGVYVSDSYDFEGDQFLGFWNDGNHAVSGWNPLVGDGVSNADFRNWRTNEGRGGDFRVLSDVKRTTLRMPHVFELRA